MARGLACDYPSSGEEVKTLKILWMSRHAPLASQEAELARLFGGDIVVEQDPRPFSSAEDIAARYRRGGYDDLVVVAPLSVLSRLVDLGLKPLWAEMTLVGRAEAEVTMPRRSGRVDYYKFTRFRRVKALRLEFEELQ